MLMERHVRVSFDGHPPLHFHAEENVAEHLACALNSSGSAQVRVDDEMELADRELPCAGLWSQWF